MVRSFLSLTLPKFEHLKRTILITLVLGASSFAKAQKVDSLFFNLYTDSLKKGVHNYINVDGKLSNGQWLPLTDKEVLFSASAGLFEGNSLVIDTAFKGEKITVKVILKSNPAVWKETVIYIKKYNVPERLKTVEEIMGQPPRKSKGKKTPGNFTLALFFFDRNSVV